MTQYLPNVWLTVEIYPLLTKCENISFNILRDSWQVDKLMYFFLEGGAGDYDKIVSKFVMNSQSMYLRYRTACSRWFTHHSKTFLRLTVALYRRAVRCRKSLINIFSFQRKESYENRKKKSEKRIEIQLKGEITSIWYRCLCFRKFKQRRGRLTVTA